MLVSLSLSLLLSPHLCLDLVESAHRSLRLLLLLLLLLRLLSEGRKRRPDQRSSREQRVGIERTPRRRLAGRVGLGSGRARPARIGLLQRLGASEKTRGGTSEIKVPACSAVDRGGQLWFELVCTCCSELQY